MRVAIEQARLCVSEDGRVSPKVGAVVVSPKGLIIGKAYRGERKPGEHAEYTLLERKLKDKTLAGSILYTTLEPCVGRNPPKLPCAEHIVARQIKHVVIGVLDPNPQIRGKGERFLTGRGIEVTRFSPNLMSEIEELQRYFNRLHVDPELKPSMTEVAGSALFRPNSTGRPKESSQSIPALNSNLSTETLGGTSTKTYSETTSFENKLGLSSVGPDEHEERIKVADELRSLRQFMSTRPKSEGEVLAAFVANATADYQLPKNSFDSQVDAYATMGALNGPLQTLVAAGVLTIDDDWQLIGVGPKHAAAIQNLCEFFTFSDYQYAKQVLKEGKWASIIPQDL